MAKNEGPTRILNLFNDTANEFERLLAGLSTSFARAAVDDIDDEIERWLGRTVSSLGADRGTVSQFDFAARIFSVTHQWAGETVPRVPKELNPNLSLPWLTGKILAGETVVFSKLEELPPQADADIRIINTFGLPKSSIAIPLAIGGVIVGALTVGAFLRERKWTHEEIGRLQLITETFSNALERKHSVGEIRRLQDELQQVAKISMMGELTAWLAHEVNQPLSAILSNAQAARRFLDSKHPNLAEVRSALGEIISDDGRAVEAIRNVRDLFRTDNAETGPVNLSTSLTDVERILRGESVRRKILLRIDLPALPVVITGHRTQLIQALLNLVVNAFDSIPEDWSGAREVAVGAKPETSRVVITVRDSGSGIDPAVLPRLFRAFVTTKPKGMGIGLAIARTIVEKHGGRLWAEPNAERGTTMAFYLPLRVSSPRK